MTYRVIYLDKGQEIDHPFFASGDEEAALRVFLLVIGNRDTLADSSDAGWTLANNIEAERCVNQWDRTTYRGTLSREAVWKHAMKFLDVLDEYSEKSDEIEIRSLINPKGEVLWTSSLPGSQVQQLL
jgi:hypothetical protein